MAIARAGGYNRAAGEQHIKVDRVQVCQAPLGRLGSAVWVGAAVSTAPEGGPPLQQLLFIRDEIRFEIGLLHDRINALLAAEAFLTIAYTAAMSDGTPWGPTFSRIVAPILALLGLCLALLAWPGVGATVRIILEWTSQERGLFDDYPPLFDTVPGSLVASRGDQGRLVAVQRRSMLFSRAVPVLFVAVWAALTFVAVAIRR